MELMGKHSNIIFCDDQGMILDSIKHVSSHMSSVREVLPGREYFIPKTQNKLDPLSVSEEDFIRVICSKPCNISKAIYSSLTGLSPVVAEEICYRASIDGSDAAQSRVCSQARYGLPLAIHSSRLRCLLSLMHGKHHIHRPRIEQQTLYTLVSHSPFAPQKP